MIKSKKEYILVKWKYNEFAGDQFSKELANNNDKYIRCFYGKQKDVSKLSEKEIKKIAQTYVGADIAKNGSDIYVYYINIPLRNNSILYVLENVKTKELADEDDFENTGKYYFGDPENIDGNFEITDNTKKIQRYYIVEKNNIKFITMKNSQKFDIDYIRKEFGPEIVEQIKKIKQTGYGKCYGNQADKLFGAISQNKYDYDDKQLKKFEGCYFKTNICEIISNDFHHDSFKTASYPFYYEEHHFIGRCYENEKTFDSFIYSIFETAKINTSIEEVKNKYQTKIKKLRYESSNNTINDWGEFIKLIESANNIINLCPTCHRMFHHAEYNIKIKMLQSIKKNKIIWNNSLEIANIILRIINEFVPNYKTEEVLNVLIKKMYNVDLGKDK